MYWSEVGGDVFRVPFELLEGEGAGVVEGLPGHPVQQRFEVLDFTLVALELVEHLLLGGFEHAVETAQNRQRQHHVLVLVWPVRPTQQVGHGPDEIDLLAEVVHALEAPSRLGLYRFRSGPVWGSIVPLQCQERTTDREKNQDLSLGRCFGRRVNIVGDGRG